MKVNLTRPIYHDGKVVTGELTTTEQHARELVRKGYAAAPKEQPKAAKEDRKPKKAA